MTAECQRQKILVVDDEADTRMFLCNLLGTCGYEAVAAAGGTEGFQKAKAEPPDLIILDIMMPRMSGFQVCRKLKSDERTKDIQVLMVTALNELGDVERLLRSLTPNRSHVEEMLASWRVSD